jgi:uncharacterized protein (DUF1778 family)
MTAARWLAEAGKPDEAVRLLRAADVIGAGKLADDYVLAGPAHLAAAQLLEAQGDTVGALESYRQFLRRLDRPGPAQLGQVEQAKAALTRLAHRKVS